jgi:glycolate oxidase iron-sulfur subunit
MADQQQPRLSWAVPESPPAQPVISELDYEGLLKCIHCGFCSQACPTYRQTGLETASPRGRLTLMRAVAEGTLPVDEGFADPMTLCLGCRACESACPSMVPYGHLLEQSRELAAKVVPPPWAVRFGMNHLLPYPGRMRLLGQLARVAQRLGLFRLLPAGLRELAEALPPIKAPAKYARASEGTVLFFHGCVQEAVLHRQNEAAMRVLAGAGTPAAVPEGQTCCGALHAHSGDLEGARSLARRNITAFERYSGPIINHAGGCGAQLKEYGHLLKDDPAWAERAAAFAARVKDLSEWLAEVGVPVGLQPLDGLTVTYQDSCHLAHGQKVRRQPRDAIRAIPGIAYKELPQADQCCGSAGIYNILRPEMAGKVLREKMGNVAATAAAVIVTANPGCYMQLCQGVRRHGLAGQAEVLSLAELLQRSLGAADSGTNGSK